MWSHSSPPFHLGSLTHRIVTAVLLKVSPSLQMRIEESLNPSCSGWIFQVFLMIKSSPVFLRRNLERPWRDLTFYSDLLPLSSTDYFSWISLEFLRIWWAVSSLSTTAIQHKSRLGLLASVSLPSTSCHCRFSVRWKSCQLSDQPNRRYRLVWSMEYAMNW